MTSTFPDTPEQATMGGIQGNVFGGHSPIIGAQLYVFQPSAGGYGGASRSILAASHAQGVDTSAANLGNYTLTSTGGTFSLGPTAYTCTVGEPVYLDAVGGTTAPGASLLTITGSTKNAGTVTFTAANTLAAGAQVSFASGAFTTASGYSGLNGTTKTIAGTPTSTTFNITFTPTGTGNPSVTGYALTGGLPNPSINNIAVVGVCVNAATFATNLPSVFMSEESTVAAAYALSGFGTGPFNISSSGTNQAVTGIGNAAKTAGQLYNITTGGNAVSNTSAGLNDQLNKTTSNGTVPSAELNTLANILAACVDSNNTTTPAPAGTACATLFNNATNNGVSGGGTIPTDIATAAFNIAQYPASNVATLYSVQGAGTAPFAPNLSSAPKDFTVTIAYSGGGLGATNGKSPHSVAVDASGNIYTVNYSASSLNIFSPLGVPKNSGGYTGENLSNPVSVAVDSGSASVWIANYGNTYVSQFYVSGAGAGDTNLGGGNAGLRDAQFDNNGYLWVTSDVAEEIFYLPFPGLTGTKHAYSPTSGTPYGIAIDPADDIWVADSDVTGVDDCPGPVNYCSEVSSGGVQYSVGDAFDSYSHVWFGNSNGTLSAFASNKPLTNSPFNTGGADQIDGIAIDGANDVWATNTAQNALYEFSNTGTAATELTPATGYAATSPDGIALDPSGNIWYNSTAANSLFEVVGAGTPVVTPIAYGVVHSKLGQTP